MLPSRVVIRIWVLRLDGVVDVLTSDTRNELFCCVDSSSAERDTFVTVRAVDDRDFEKCSFGKLDATETLDKVTIDDRSPTSQSASMLVRRIKSERDTYVVLIAAFNVLNGRFRRHWRLSAALAHPVMLTRALYCNVVSRSLKCREVRWSYSWLIVVQTLTDRDTIATFHNGTADERIVATIVCNQLPSHSRGASAASC